ncbi:MAG: hypothetical protein GY777_16845 [Candidatus Brocadiaceae bacterium]|nr:hypothetical protein [Candidatus Brocadiaceae bacterium]
MELLQNIFLYEIWILLGGFAVVISYQMLTGRINMAGLLLDKETKLLSPGRLQLLVFTIIFAIYYLSNISTQYPYFPEIPEEALWFLAASHSGYLGLKAKNIFVR